MGARGAAPDHQRVVAVGDGGVDAGRQDEHTSHLNERHDPAQPVVGGERGGNQVKLIHAYQVPKNTIG